MLDRLSGLLRSRGFLLPAYWALATVLYLSLESCEGRLTDRMARWRAAEADPQIALCLYDVDSFDLLEVADNERLRLSHAGLIRCLKEGGARAIALTTAFETRNWGPGHEVLATAVREAENVALGFFYETTPGPWLSSPIRPIARITPPFELFAPRYPGFLNVWETDGVLRHVRLAVSYERSASAVGRQPELHYPLAARAVQIFSQAGRTVVGRRGDSEPIQLWIGERAVPLGQQGLLRINYRKGNHPVRPAHEVVDREGGCLLRGERSDLFTDRMVFVGIADTDIEDKHRTPAGWMWGAEVHAHIADTLLRQDFLRDGGVVDNWLPLLVALAIGPLVAAIAARARSRAGLLWGSLPLLLWAAVSTAAFAGFGVHLRLLAPVVAGLVAWAVVARRHLRESDPRPVEAHDVFLCHNSSDKGTVRDLADRLEGRGIRPWLDVKLRPGRSFQRKIVEAIKNTRSAAVFLGREGRLGPWQEQELDLLVAESTEREYPLIPVLLPQAPEGVRLPGFLKTRHWVDFRRRDPDPIEELIRGIRAEGPADAAATSGPVET